VVPSSVINIPHLEDVDLHVVNSRSPHRLGLIVDPERDNLPFSFSVEILEPNFTTMMDVNPGFQLFYVLKGSGQAFCMDSQGHAREHTVRFGVGDSLLFPPKRLHGIISTDEPLTLLGLMLHAPGIGHTAKEFVQWVQESPPAGKLTEEELTALYKDFQRSYQKDESAAAEAPAAAAAAAANATAGTEAPPPHLRGAEAAGPGEGAAEPSDERVLWPDHRRMSELRAKQLRSKGGVAAAPTNRLLLVFDSATVPFLFALEVFEKDHVTPIHSHPTGHELFYILQGEGEAICDGHSWPVRAGDTAVFPVNSMHGLNNTGGTKMCALELMVPSNPELLATVSGPCSALVQNVEGRGGVPVVPWDTTCMLDGTTGRLACSELGFGEAVRTGNDAANLDEEEMCGFAPKTC